MSRLRAVLDGMNDLEKVLFPALAMAAVGWGLVWMPLALIVPSAVLIFIVLRANPQALAELGALEDDEVAE
jgi:hypothetical protein